MKKILSLFLATLFVLPTFFLVPGVSASNASVSSEARLLEDLGIIDLEQADNSLVTRGEFVRYTTSLASIPLSPFVGCEFEDVPPTDSNYAYIMSAVDFGLVSKSESFRPNDSINAFEAAKILVTLLGYDFLAEEMGGYPYGYMQIAQNIGLFSDIGNFDVYLTKENVIKILYNALHAKMVDVTYDASGAVQYSTGSATILGRYRGIYTVSGTVDASQSYSMNSNKGLGTGRISVDGTIYKTGNLNTNEIFGYSIEGYIDADTNTLVSYCTTDSNRVLKLFAENMISFEDNEFKYYDDKDRMKTVSIDVDTNIFYNGSSFEFNEETIIPSSGSLTFISSSKSGTYDTLIIKSYKTVVVDRISSTDSTFVNKYDRANNVTLDTSKADISVTDQNGNPMEVSGIAPGDVLCVAVSYDKSVAEVICVRDEIMGTYDGRGDNTIQIYGVPYEMTPEVKSRIDSLATLGSSYIVKLDIDSRVADIIPSSASSNFEVGYLYSGKYISEGLDGYLAARILKVDGSKVTFKFAKSFSIDGVAYSDGQKAYNENKSPDYNSLVCSVVRFSINDNGEITKLVYPEDENGKNGLYTTYAIENPDEYVKFEQWWNTIGTGIFGDTTMKVFKVPNPLYNAESPDDDMYSVETPFIIADNYKAQGYRLEGYTTKPDCGFADYLLMQRIADDATAAADTPDSYPCMVSSFKKVVYDGRNCEALELFGDNSNPTIYSYHEDDFSKAGVKEGDIIRYARTESGVTASVEILYKRGSDTLENGTLSWSDSGGSCPQMALYLSKAFKFRGDIIEKIPYDILPENAVAADIKPIYTPGFEIVRYDERLNRVVQSSSSEIKDYLSFGSDCTSFIYEMGYNAQRTIYILD